MTKLVYVAGPYTKGIWEYNLREVITAAERLFKEGYIPFIPHTMTTLWALLHPKGKEQWLEIDLEILSRCDVLLRIDGDSEGAEIEVDYAQDHDIPVYESVDELVANE